LAYFAPCGLSLRFEVCYENELRSVVYQGWATFSKGEEVKTEVESGITWGTIMAEEVRPTAIAFHGAHAECATMVHIERGSSSLVCWCERCKDLRAYEIDSGRASSPAA
jgi:hypothetical protein